MPSTFPRTLTAARDLLKDLQCDSCSRLLRQPCALAVCEHFLCGRCSDDLSNTCPVCGVPCRPTDLRPQQNLHELTFASLSLIRLLSGQDAERNDSPSDCSKRNSKTDSLKDAKKSFKENTISDLALSPSKRKDDTATETSTLGSSKRSFKEDTSPHESFRRRSRGEVATVSFAATPSRLSKRNARGETALHVAAARGVLERVKELLAVGLDPNAVDNAGWTPLHEAVNRGHVEVASALLEAGAGVNALGCDQDTPLHDALENGRIECVLLLLRHGAGLDTPNAEGKTPRQIAEAFPELRDALSTQVEVAPAPRVSPVPVLPPVFLVTGLTRKERMLVHKAANLLRAEMAPEMSPRVTHLICRINAQGTCPRTLKYLHAVLNGCWIVDFDWAQSCLSLKQRVTEEPFEVGGCSSQPGSMAAKKGRENAQADRPPLFSGCNFYFEGSFSYPTPSKEELIALVRRGGGEVLSQRPRQDSALELSRPHHAEGALRSCGAFLVREAKGTGEETVVGSPICCMRPSWIMNCCAAFRLLEP